MDSLPRKKCKRHDIPGHAHCLTFSCFQRLPLFTRERTCRWMLDALELGRKQGKYDLWAYVIMPEHVHLVLLPHSNVTISQILSTLKQSVSKKALLWLRDNAPDFFSRLEVVMPNGQRKHHFWQRGGGYDRNLRSLADIFAKIEYTHGNPVRRGLVADAQAWPWSSSRARETGEDIPIALDRHSLPTLMPDDMGERRR